MPSSNDDHPEANGQREANMQGMRNVPFTFYADL